jgi:hypothetical protein
MEIENYNKNTGSAWLFKFQIYIINIDIDYQCQH